MLIITNELIEHAQNAYDLRQRDFSNEYAYALGQAFGTCMRYNNACEAVIGHDRRLFSKNLHDCFAKGAQAVGVNITSIGQIGTGAIQLAEIIMQKDACVSITASHNSADYHGMKFFLHTQAFSGALLSQMLTIIRDGKFFEASAKGSYCKHDFRPQYSESINSKIKITNKFKIGWCFCNGCAGDVFSYLNLPTPSHSSPYIIQDSLDHEFGGYAPDPTYMPRLVQLQNLIAEKNLDFGIAIDGDADRCVILDSTGAIVPGDKMIAMFGYLLHKQSLAKKIEMIWDVKSSSVLIDWSKAFSNSFISKTGHSNIQHLNNIICAAIAGECSGHYFFADFYNISDGIYTALNFITLLEKNNETLSNLLKLIPQTYLLQEKKFTCNEMQKKNAIDIVRTIFEQRNVSLDFTDGVKIIDEHGSILIRASRTEDILRISGEAINLESLEIKQMQMDDVLNYIFQVY